MSARARPAPARGALVLVHGLGRFGGGREAVRYLARHGCRVRVADRGDGPDLQAVRDNLDEPAVDWQLGREDEALLDGVELVVQNPAVPDGHPLIAAAVARGIALTQELDLFLSAYPGRVVGVTGTNGKSTTATLLHRALRRAGHDALLGGNIGHSLLADEAVWRADQTAVVEMSSFQLERLAGAQRVHGAVFTRITSDHLDRHGTLAAYRAAKSALARAAREFVVHAADDDVAAGFETAAARRVRYALTEPAPDSIGVLGGWLALRLGRAAAAERIVHRRALRLLGDFQVENAMAAAAAARCLGAPRDPVGLALATAPPLPFRLQRVAAIGGVEVWDNAVSTEIGSTVSALDALARGRAGRIHWVGGGVSKDRDYARVASSIAPRVASANLFGDAAGPLLERWPGGDTAAAAHARLEDALAAALRAAAPGDTVLFSPAFASFDQFPNFRARGLAFHEWLVSRRAETTVSG